jgi:hypothetical protein
MRPARYEKVAMSGNPPTTTMPKPVEPVSLPILPLARTRKDTQGQNKHGLITEWMNSNISPNVDHPRMQNQKMHQKKEEEGKTFSL